MSIFYFAWEFHTNIHQRSGSCCFYKVVGIPGQMDLLSQTFGGREEYILSSHLQFWAKFAKGFSEVYICILKLDAYELNAPTWFPHHIITLWQHWSILNDNPQLWKILNLRFYIMLFSLFLFDFQVINHSLEKINFSLCSLRYPKDTDPSNN